MTDLPDPDPPDLTALLLTDDLRTALRRRAAVGRAVGVIMARRNCSPGKAAGILRSAARHRAMAMHELCAELVEGFDEQPARREPGT
ncbi:ANTAR domain-containing protein [Streptomyces sp. DvalAA-14]|uniref:ANTAR domain-containing protein n=1 Tax=unclassified Streptomyces TaxID=2593676 RepID=UPI00081B3FBF|nr:MULTISPECIES: ANTAR domain-containing protein [unclassified Streptomyces]MYS24246.1 ANTAR domain-containing protein [Streptomyces sp. SID4948]SCE44198.1 ANTAR domain-containing protein [Streptomyces sp. DvalAA-14]